jgi:D-alanyl-D-alanine carboxypeptidase/D-alanyl-D-alanine-endopeptidase (penicillin-binding protein 4)
LFLVLVAIVQCADAVASTGTVTAAIDDIIAKSGLDVRSTVAISVVDLDSGEVAYRRNDEKLMPPASILKVFSLAAAIDTLGSDYEFETSIFEHGRNLYLKLGADPLLTTADLRILVRQLKRNCDTSKICGMFIDDGIADKIPYPAGWGSDDLLPSQPMMSPYTLNGNRASVKFSRAQSGTIVNVEQPNPYKHSLVNRVTAGDENWVGVSMENGETAAVFTLHGVISDGLTLNIPVASPMRNFTKNFARVLGEENIDCGGIFSLARTPKGARKVATVSHTLRQTFVPLLHESNNFVAETIFKVAGLRFRGKSSGGSTKDGVAMFYDFYSKLGVDISQLQLSDGSGMSMYNRVQPKWETCALMALAKRSDILKFLSRPGDGGKMANRLTQFSDRLRAKTGMLAGVATMCGCITSRTGKRYVFSIMTANADRKLAHVRALIDAIVEEIANL